MSGAHKHPRRLITALPETFAEWDRAWRRMGSRSWSKWAKLVLSIEAREVLSEPEPGTPLGMAYANRKHELLEHVREQLNELKDKGIDRAFGLSSSRTDIRKSPRARSKADIRPAAAKRISATIARRPKGKR